MKTTRAVAAFLIFVRCVPEEWGVKKQKGVLTVVEMAVRYRRK